MGALKALKTGTLKIAAHESAAVYLLPAPLRSYLTRFPDVKVGIYRSPLTEIPRQVMDREVARRLRQGRTELSRAAVHRGARRRDDPGRRAAPSAGANGTSVHVRDLGAERFVVHHLCSTTEQKILRLFEQHSTPCRIAAELWSFENIKSFVQAEVGMAIVPRITVAQELRDRTLVQIPRRGAQHAAAHADDLSRAGLPVGGGARADQDRQDLQLGRQGHAAADGGGPQTARVTAATFARGPMAFDGVFSVLPTPFVASGDIDLDSLKRVVDLFIAAGVNGLTALGVTGEVARLTESERDAVLDTVVAQVNGRVPIVAGTTADGLRTCIEYTPQGEGRRRVRGDDQPAAHAEAQLGRGREALRGRGRRRRHPDRRAGLSADLRLCDGGVAARAHRARRAAARTIKLEDPPTPFKTSRILEADEGPRRSRSSAASAACFCSRN